MTSPFSGTHANCPQSPFLIHNKHVRIGVFWLHFQHSNCPLMFLYVPILMPMFDNGGYFYDVQQLVTTFETFASSLVMFHIMVPFLVAIANIRYPLVN